MINRISYRGRWTNGMPEALSRLVIPQHLYYSTLFCLQVSAHNNPVSIDSGLKKTQTLIIPNSQQSTVYNSETALKASSVKPSTSYQETWLMHKPCAPLPVMSYQCRFHSRRKVLSTTNDQPRESSLGLLLQAWASGPRNNWSPFKEQLQF